MIEQKLLLLYTTMFLTVTQQSAFHIYNCSGVRDVTEGTDVSFTCGPYNYQVEWHSSSNYVEWNYIGHCERTKCHSQKSSSFALNSITISIEGYESTLDVKRVTRQQDTYLKCRYKDTSDVCELRIVAPSIAKLCEVRLSNWRVYGSCAVEKMFPSDGKYSCMWSVNNEKLTSYESLSKYWIGGRIYKKGFCTFNQTMPVDYGTYTYRVSINPGPSNFVVETITIVPISIIPNTCSVQPLGWKVFGVCTVQRLMSLNSRMCKCILKKTNNTEELHGFQGVGIHTSTDTGDYIGENCSFLDKMPVDDDNYTYSYSLSSKPDDQCLKTIYIEKPDVPQHNCSKMILEGSNMTCTCFTPNLGNPLAQVGWEESSKTYLAITGRKQQQGMVYTCSLTWGVLYYTTPYVVNIAYGPSQTYINSRVELSGDETKTRLICTAIDVYPAAVFHWNISCDKETHGVNTSTCTVSTARVEDNTAVACMASNQIFVEVFSTSTYVLKHKRKPDVPQHNCSKMILEGSNMTCTCFTTNLGNPPAQVAWEVSSKKYLTITGRKQKQGMVYTCSLTLGVLYYTTPYVVNIAWKPDVPQHNCSKMILEGSTMTCTCFTPNLGNPPAQVGWEGSSKKYLTITGRKQNQGMVYTCSLTWGVLNYTTPYVVNIAYGPSQTYINSRVELSGDETKTRLICTAIDVYPAAVFHWNISCDNETHGVNTSTCTVSTARVEDNTAVACMACNQMFVEVFSTSIYVLKHKRKQKDNSHQAWILAVGVAVMIIFTIIMAVIFVFIIRGKANKSQPHSVHFAAPSRDVDIIGEIATVTRRENEYITFCDLKLLTGYVTIPEVPTNSELGVYHHVLPAASSEGRISDVNDGSEEYNVLRLRENRTRQEDYSATYSHLDFN